MRETTLAAFLLLTVACRQNPANGAGFVASPQLTSERITISAFDGLLSVADLVGSILIYDATADTFYSNDFERAETKFIPASTFKIANSIVGLEVGTLDADTTVFRWDGTPRFMDAWEQDLKLADAFRLSCVPCYRELARRTGAERMESGLKRIGYPGMVFDTSTIDDFWLTGGSEISQFEQIDFLRRLREGELPIEVSTASTLRRIMVVDSTRDFVLRGKTGWATGDGFDLGWFVGYLEDTSNTYYIATNVEPLDRSEGAGFAEARLEVSRAALGYFSRLGKRRR